MSSPESSSNSSQGSPPETRALEMGFDIDAPVEAVWACLTDAEELTRWFPPQARVKPGEGGSIWMSWDGEHEGEMAIIMWEPPQRLALGYSTRGPDGEPASLAQAYRIDERGRHARLQLLHAGFGKSAAWDALYDGTRRGWEFELRGLKHYLEHHRGTPRQVVHARRFVDTELNEAWAALLGPRGLGMVETEAGGQPADMAEGDSYRMKVAAGIAGDERARTLSGTIALFGPPRDMAATLREANDAYLRLRLDGSFLQPGRNEVNLWLSTYGLKEGDREDWRKSFEATLDELFPPGK